jgi:hypothetical protein
MYSFPNLIPLSRKKVNHIVSKVNPLNFDRIYGAWDGRLIANNAKEVVNQSADRYKKAISEED